MMARLPIVFDTYEFGQTNWRSLAIWTSVVALAIGGCRGKANDSPPADATGKRYAADSEKGGDANRPIVRIETNLGAIDIRLDAEHSPVTAQNFLDYVADGYYTNTLFHYVAPDKMILGGGFTPDGLAKPARLPILNEAHNGLKNVRGTIAMTRDAASGIDSATSQFFINLADAPNFDHRGEATEEYGYCVFGEVIKGLDVAEKISRVATRDQGGELQQTPDPAVVIQAVRVAP
jgi:peptidyl-prolyl cis-trans isomerase A (cyclophilin A)